MYTSRTLLRPPSFPTRHFSLTATQVLQTYTLKSGFEIHCQTLTKTKLFSQAMTPRVGVEEGTMRSRTSPSNKMYKDMAIPGTLPVLNQECLRVALKASLALNGKIDRQNGYDIRFDRKHYFYSDLPQGYQITQKDHPVMENGYLRYFNKDNKEARIGIDRIQIEQDSAKSTHDFERYSAVDYSRAGAALLEIVTFPEVDHPTDAKIVVREIQETLKELNISLANMEEGQMRCDVNISISHKTDPNKRGDRVELKNLQGVKFVEKAIEAEIIRQAELLESGKPVSKQTRRYDAGKDKTILLREKEEDLDYRFMYDPDLPTFFISPSLITSVARTLTPLPFEYKKALIETYFLSVDQAQFMYSHPQLVTYFKSVCASLAGTADSQMVYNWIFIVFMGNCTKKNIEDFAQKAEECFGQRGEDYLVRLIRLQCEEKISFSHAKMVLFEMIDGDQKSPEEIAEENGYLRSEAGQDLDAVNDVIDGILEKNEEIVSKIKGQGSKKKGGPVMFLVGQAMKELKANGDPKYVQDYIRKRIFG